MPITNKFSNKENRNAGKGSFNPATGEVQATPWAWKLPTGVYVDISGQEVWMYRLIDMQSIEDLGTNARIRTMSKLDRLLKEIGQSVKGKATRQVHIVQHSWQSDWKAPKGMSLQQSAFIEACVNHQVPQ